MQIAFAMPTKMPPKYCAVFVKLKLKMKCILFASVRYTTNFVRDTSTSTCKLNSLLRSWCSVTRKAQVKTLHFLYFMPVKNAIFTCYLNRLVIVRGFPWGQTSNGACGRVWLHVTKRIVEEGKTERERVGWEKGYTSVFAIPDFRSRRENHQPSTLHVIRPYVWQRGVHLH